MKQWLRFIAGFFLMLLVVVLAACQSLTPQEIIFEDAVRQQHLRSLQSHTYDIEDEFKVMRAVIATLQDLDFVISQADSRLGFVSAVLLSGYNLNISVMVNERVPGKIEVRISLVAGFQTIPDDAYQMFFSSLQENLVTY